jgi:energy-coupling factor transport system ATP-binding protein
VQPSKGKIKIGKTVLEKGKNKRNIESVRRNVGLVYQDPEQQFFNSTVKKEIEFALLNFNYMVDEKEKRVIDALKLVGLDESYLERNPLNLSTGEQKKLSMAITFAYNPKIILLDEPTLGLDDESKRQLVKLLRMMKVRYNKTIIMVCNDTDFMHEVVDYIYVMDKGEMIFHGDKYTVFSDDDITTQFNIRPPKIMRFSNLVKQKKNINLGYRDDIDDLAKDVYRNVK